jgi:hypothetical protein
VEMKAGTTFLPSLVAIADEDSHAQYKYSKGPMLVQPVSDLR